jgi:hypothetical protein
VSDDDDVDVKLFLTAGALSAMALDGDDEISSAWRACGTTAAMHQMLETHPMMAVLCV